MHICRIKALALTTCAVFAITAVGDLSLRSGYDFSTVTSAYAGNGNGGGNGGGRGGGNGGGNGKGGGYGKGGGLGAEKGNGGLLGKSGGLMSAFTGKGNKGKSSGSNKSGKSLFDNLGLGFGKDKSRNASSGKRTDKTRGPKVDLAAVPVPAAKPAAKVEREKNFRAKLAGLNSLNRNYHAYMNAQDPRMAAIRDYVMASVDYETAAASLEEALAELGLAEDTFAGVVSSLYDGLTTYDGVSLTETDIAGLESRLTDLENLDLDSLSDDQKAAVQAEIDAINAALSSEEAASLQTAQDEAGAAQDEVDELAGQITDEALTEALLAAANQNRIEEYGVENYVDEEMLDWAKDLLGVDEAYGKIDQVREALESEESADAESDTATETDEIES